MNNQIIFASKAFLPLSVGPRRIETVETVPSKRRKPKGPAGPSHATPGIRRLENRLDVVPRPYRPFMTASQFKTPPNPKPGQHGNHCQLQEVMSPKDSHASLRLIAHPYRPLLPPIPWDRIPPNQSCISLSILGVKGTIFLRVTRL